MHAASSKVSDSHFLSPLQLTIYDLASDHLAESPFADDIDHIIRCFDKSTKPRFRNTNEPQYIKFGSIRDNDATVGIRSGQLKLRGCVNWFHMICSLPNLSNIYSRDVALFFKPSIDCIVKAVHEQRRVAHKPISVSPFRAALLPYAYTF